MNNIYDEDLISVIVPIYNTKDYLERCYASIATQTYRNLEIILVDDGSTDGSGILCDILAERDSRVKAVHKRNGGAGSAKNTGFEVATGKYLALVDSDDWISPDMYMVLYNMIQAYQAQIAICGIQRVTTEGEITFYNDAPNETILYSTEEALMELPLNVRITNSMCNKLFDRACIDGLKMNEQLAYDDNPFVPQCIARAERIIYTSVPYYSYFQRQGSISKSVFSLREFDRVTADQMRLAFYQENYPQCEDAAAIAYIGTCLKVYFQAARSKDAVKEKRKILEKELRKTIREYSSLPFTTKQKIKVKLFEYSPVLYTLFMIIRGK